MVRGLVIPRVLLKILSDVSLKSIKPRGLGVGSTSVHSRMVVVGGKCGGTKSLWHS